MIEPARTLSWFGIIRLGLVQASLGAIVVLTTSTLNRIMQVELQLPALVPGLLVAIHYAFQMLRPRMGHGSDVGGRRTPWIIGGMVVLAAGGVLAAVGTAWMETAMHAGLAVAVIAFVLIGIGVSAAGTPLLVLLAKQTEVSRRPAAATIVWMMMILGFALTAGMSGRFLDPYSPGRLITVTAVVSLVAVMVSVLAIWGVEVMPGSSTQTPEERAIPFRIALAEIWAEPQARLFTIFIFVSMFAYSAQDLILEPFAALLYGLTPGETTSLSGVQHGGVFAGMVVVGLAGSFLKSLRVGSLRLWTLGGCIASAVALAGLACVAAIGPVVSINALVFALGFANGAFAIAAIGSMMTLAGQGRAGREGVRMGLWGAAQGIAFGAGGFMGAAASDVARLVLGSPIAAHACVFAFEAVLFLVAAAVAARVRLPDVARRETKLSQTKLSDVSHSALGLRSSEV
jgi:MFS transporter, BCD family, chlorophyll transporter